MAARKKTTKKKGPGDDLLNSIIRGPKPTGWSLGMGGSLGVNSRGFGGGGGGEFTFPIVRKKKTSITGSVGFGGGGSKIKGGPSGYGFSARPGVTITRTIGTKKKKRK